jgi:hypothetical protein
VFTRRIVCGPGGGGRLISSERENLDEAKRSKMAATLRGFRTERHPRLRDLDGLRSDELPFKLGLAVLDEHGDDLFKILPQFVHRGAL